MWQPEPSRARSPHEVWDSFVDELDRAGQAGSAADVSCQPVSTPTHRMESGSASSRSATSKISAGCRGTLRHTAVTSSKISGSEHRRSSRPTSVDEDDEDQAESDEVRE